MTISSTPPSMSAAPAAGLSNDATGRDATPSTSFDLLLTPTAPNAGTVTANESENETDDSDSDESSDPSQAVQTSIVALFTVLPIVNTAPEPMPADCGGAATGAANNTNPSVPSTGHTPNLAAALATTSTYPSETSTGTADAPTEDSRSNPTSGDEQRHGLRTADFAAPQNPTLQPEEIRAANSSFDRSTETVLPNGSQLPLPAGDTDISLSPDPHVAISQTRGTAGAKGGIEMFDAAFINPNAASSAPAVFPSGIAFTTPPLEYGNDGNVADSSGQQTEAGLWTTTAKSANSIGAANPNDVAAVLSRQPTTTTPEMSASLPQPSGTDTTAATSSAANIKVSQAAVAAPITPTSSDPQSKTGKKADRIDATTRAKRDLNEDPTTISTARIGAKPELTHTASSIAPRSNANAESPANARESAAHATTGNKWTPDQAEDSFSPTQPQFAPAIADANGPRSTTPPMIAQRPLSPAAAVEEVGLALERIQQRSNNHVDLHLSLEGGERLSVELQVRDGAVHASFLTGSTELREALEKGWAQLSIRSENAGLPLVAPIFKAPNAPSMNTNHQDSRERHNEPEQHRNLPAFYSTSPQPKRPSTTPRPVQPATSGLNAWA